MALMHVWSRKLCRWVVWHGSRAVWLALPAAILTSACVGAIALATQPSETTTAPAYAAVPASWHPAPSIAVPEPTSLAVLATAVVMLALARTAKNAERLRKNVSQHWRPNNVRQLDP